MNLVNKHKSEHSAAVVRSAELGGGWPQEADERVNGSARRLIEAVAERFGSAWIGRINLHTDAHREAPVWKWDGVTTPNFVADFVVPGTREVDNLRAAILSRDADEYTGTSADYDRIKTIIHEVERLGGVLLLWT